MRADTESDWIEKLLGYIVWAQGSRWNKVNSHCKSLTRVAASEETVSSIYINNAALPPETQIRPPIHKGLYHNDSLLYAGQDEAEIDYS